MASKDDFKTLIRLAKQQGWSVEHTRGGHLRWRAPSGYSVFSASTPGDKRAVANHVAQLRRNGFIPA